MKKIYTLASMMMFGLSVFAQGTMTDQNAALEEMGYRLEKDVDWYGGTINGVSFCPDGYEMGSGDEALSYVLPAPSDACKVNTYLVTFSNTENMEWFGRQTWQGTSLLNKIGVNPGKGIVSTDNGRWIVFRDLKPGQILAFDVSDPDSTRLVPNSMRNDGSTDWKDVLTEPLQAVDISYEVHSLQELASEGSADTYRYFRVTPDNPDGLLFVRLAGQGGVSLWHTQIWTSNDAPEYVSAPTLTMTGVMNTSRRLLVKYGESSLGNAVQVYYSTDDSDPLYLVETEEIDHYDYTFDEETGEKLDSVPVYKMKAEQRDGYWGEEIVEDEEFHVDKVMDEDGDGVVHLKMRTVSSTGNYSPLTEMLIPVGTIVLNEPTFALVGMDGVSRTYKIQWVNNTLCKEETKLFVKIDGEDVTTLTIGDLVSAKESLYASISCSGYASGETSIDVDAKGVAYEAKGEQATWDFVNLSEEVIEKIDHRYVVSAFYYDLAKNDTTWYTRDEYLNYQTEAGEELPEETEAVYGSFGWDELDSRQAGRHWMSSITDTLHTLSYEGLDSVYYEFSYAPDQLGLFHDGLYYYTPFGGSYPNPWPAIAIFTNDPENESVNHGIVNGGGKPATLTVPNVKYGEYVLVQTSTGSTCEPAQATWNPELQQDEYGYTKSLPSNTYLWKVQVFSTPELPDAISSVAKNNVASKSALYNLAGQKVGKDFKGIVISGGKKFLVK